MSDLDKDNWLQKLFIDQAKPALDRHEGSGESVKYSEGLEFEEYSSGSYYAVVGIGTCTDTELTIPPFHNGRLVGAIEYGALWDADFTSVVIPDTMLDINGDSFMNCENLTNVIMGGSVAYIWETVFSGCTNLKRVDFSRHSFVPKVSEDWPFEFNHEDLQIKVPADLYDEWIAATNWCDYADYIVTEFTN